MRTIYSHMTDESYHQFNEMSLTINLMSETIIYVKRESLGVLNLLLWHLVSD